MSYSADGAPIDLWQIAWNAVGPFRVDTWKTSFKTAGFTEAHRVVGKHGFQCLIPFQNDGEWEMASGAVIMSCRKYAQAVCDAANSGKLKRQSEPQTMHRAKRA